MLVCFIGNFTFRKLKLELLFILVFMLVLNVVVCYADYYSNLDLTSKLEVNPPRKS